MSNTIFESPVRIPGNKRIPAIPDIIVVPHGPRMRSEIRALYLLLKAERGPLGKVTADEKALGGGAVVECSNGLIAWSADTDAHAVWGPIAARYRDLGGPTGFLGFPVSDVVELPGGGRQCRFQGATLLWDGNAQHRPFEIHGAIRDAFENGNGLAQLGFPTCDETPFPGTDVRYNTFDKGGIIVWKPSAGARIIPSLRLRLGKVSSGAINDGWLNTDAELVTYHTVTVDGRALATRKRVPSGHAGTSQDIDTPYGIAVKPTTRFTLKIDVDDWDRASGNDWLATFERTFDIGTFWGLAGGSDGVYVDLPATSKGGDTPKLDTIRFSFSVSPTIALDPNKPFLQQYWWRSDNFPTASLSWQQFADTFTDVEPEAEKWLHPFDLAFYQAYKRWASRGNCFGMCVEAMYARVGRSVFAEPLYQHKMNAADAVDNTPENILAPVRAVLNDKHAYQLGSRAIRWLAERIVTGDATSPLTTYARIKAALRNRDWPLVAMVDMVDFRGHAVMPYRCVDGDGSPGNPHKIFVADPNHPWRPGIAVDPAWIEVYKDNTFRHVDGRYRSRSIAAGVLPGALLVDYPYHVLSTPPSTPFWEIMLGLTVLLGGALILFGDAETRQVSTGDRRFYRFDGDERIGVEKDGIPGMLRVPLFDAAANAPELWTFVDKVPPRVMLDVAGTANGRYQQHVKSKSNAFTVDSPVAASGRDAITLDKLDTPVPMVTLETSESAKTARVACTALGAAPADHRQFAFDLQMAGGAPARVGITEDGAAYIAATGPAKPVMVELQLGLGATAKKGRLRLEPQSGEVLRLRPTDWASPQGEIVIERLQSIGGSVVSRTTRPGQ